MKLLSPPNVREVPMKARLCLLALFLTVATVFAIHCSRDSNPLSNSTAHRSSPLRSNPLAGRTNPLQTFIRTHWTDDDPDATGGLHYSHIKIYGHCYSNLQYTVSDYDAQAQFVADHFDMYMWGGSIVGQKVDPDDFLWLGESACTPRACPATIEDWLSQPGHNPQGYTLDDHLMHYKWNTYNYVASDTVPGWNEDDDWDYSGCIDSTEGCGGAPCDSERSAQCIWDARVNGFQGSCDYRYALLKDPYHDYVVGYTVYRHGIVPTKGYHFDCVAYENPSLGLDRTLTYDGEDESDPNFLYMQDLYSFVPWVVSDLETQVGPLDVYIANCVSPYYTCANPYQKAAALENLENIFAECWMFTNHYNINANFRTDRIDDWLNCPYLDYLEAGKGYVFCCYDMASGEAGSDRGRGFSLATFYMINHQMAFYYYRTRDHMISDPQKVWTCYWNPMVQFNVGQPHTNALGLPDYQGNYNTDRYFVWAQEANRYKILGREYVRSDGKWVLVLTKIRDPYNSFGEGQDPTTHTLPLKWYRLMPDMTWSGPLTYITLTNNEGAILLKYVKGQPEPPDPFMPPE
jgi:hypothetical protein